MKTTYRCGCVAKGGQVTRVCEDHEEFAGKLQSDLEDAIEADAADA